MLTFDLSVQFTTPGYIAHPYWPEMDRLINIQKQSGINRARSSANRRKALEEYIKTAGMTLAEYDALVVAANRPFHTNASGAVIIPADKVLSFIVAATDEARAASKPCPPEQVRSRIRATDWTTEKTAPDGVWERYAVVSSGTGAKLSNQRGLRRSAFVKEFTASGSVRIDPEFVRPEVLKRLIEWGGETVGIGAARKMGWGRFTLATWVAVEADTPLKAAA